VNLSGRERVLLRVPEFLRMQDVAPDGRVLMTAGSLRSEVIGRLPGDTNERNLSWLDGSSYTELSRDGRHILFFEASELATYLRPTDGGPPVRLFQGKGMALSPDGRWAVRVGGQHYTGRYQIMPTQAGEPRWIDTPKIAPWGIRWFDDGKRLLLTGNEATKPIRAWVIDVETGVTRVITPEGVGCWLVSPDGRMAACARPEGDEAWLYPVDAATPGTQPRRIGGFLAGDHMAQWSQDGRYVYVSAKQARPARVFRIDLQTGARELWREFAPANPIGVRGTIDPAITPDGATYAYSALRHLNDLYIVDGVK
jgi:dipeptidyl aminopeptidase/acylaminoacyl peptidase